MESQIPSILEMRGFGKINLTNDWHWLVHCLGALGDRNRGRGFNVN